MNTMPKETENGDETELELKVLRQRYELAREEVITRMKARYTVVAFLLTFVSASVGFVGVSKVFEYGFIADLVIFSGVIFLMVESWRILQLDTYLSSIQTRINSLLNLELNGWEAYLRKMKHGKRPNKWLLVGFAVLFVPVYTAFNIMSSFYSDFSYLSVCSSVVLPVFAETVLRFVLSILMEMPVVYCLYQAYSGHKSWQTL